MKDPLRLLPGYALRRASNAMLSDLAQRLSPIGLTPTEASALMLIGANPGITQSDIGRALDIQRANMTPLTARLETRRYVVRERVDGRSQGLTLSTEGQAMLTEVERAVKAHEAQLIDRIPAENRASFLAGLSALWEV